MTDTQWPRYEVFKQDKSGRPYEAIGTVHASDGEIALQNARDVHVRRPDCHGLWVAPELAILKVTAQQLKAQTADLLQPDEQKQLCDVYQVFAKKTLRRSMAAVTHVGQVEANSAEHALALALDNPSWNKEQVYVWWIVPDASIIRNQDDDILSMFEPATRKTYKQQSRYGLIERTRQTSATDSHAKQPSS